MAYIRSQGCTIWRQDPEASPVDAYVQIGQVVSIGGPQGSAGTIDVTHLSSTGREFIQALADYGTVSLGVIWDPVTASTQHDELFDDFASGRVTTYQIRLSNSPATLLTFDAFVQEHPVTIEIDDAVKATITLKTTGSVVRT
jgi:predicted secreted protein